VGRRRERDPEKERGSKPKRSVGGHLRIGVRHDRGW
jgi:hypothetical protein